jgi:hypothetical protein
MGVIPSEHLKSVSEVRLGKASYHLPTYAIVHPKADMMFSEAQTESDDQRLQDAGFLRTLAAGFMSSGMTYQGITMPNAITRGTNHPIRSIITKAYVPVVTGAWMALVSHLYMTRDTWTSDMVQWQVLMIVVVAFFAVVVYFFISPPSVLWTSRIHTAIPDAMRSRITEVCAWADAYGQRIGNLNACISPCVIYTAQWTEQGYRDMPVRDRDMMLAIKVTEPDGSVRFLALEQWTCS